MRRPTSQPGGILVLLPKGSVYRLGVVLCGSDYETGMRPDVAPNHTGSWVAACSSGFGTMNF